MKVSTLKKLLDSLAVIFPFEKACYAAEHAAFLRTSLQEHYSQHAIRIELERCRELESLLVDRLIHLSGS